MQSIDKEKAIKIGETVEPIKINIGDISNFLERKKTEAEVELEGRLDIIKLRRRWSNWILGCVVSIVFFDQAVIFLVGIKVIDFGNDNAIVYLIIEGIVKIITLAIIIVNFLFDRNSVKKSND